MSLTSETINDLSVGSGILVSLWNFIIGGDLNMLIAAFVGLMSLIVLFQRYRINKKELKHKKK